MRSGYSIKRKTEKNKKLILQTKKNCLVMRLKKKKSDVNL